MFIEAHVFIIVLIFGNPKKTNRLAMQNKCYPCDLFLPASAYVRTEAC